MNHQQHNTPTLAHSPLESADNTPALSPSAVMYWDGGERAITAREKALIEEHRPSCFTIPLLPAEAVDPTDPWRGLYLPARMPAPSEYGDLTHPDIPRWPDDREDALDTLVHAQGFDFHIVAGDFTEAALEDADEQYWQEMRDWSPEAPEGEWRLAWKGDTEDGPYAWFVRPMALRPEAVAPPAQGIDLGQFREAVELLEWVNGGHNNPDWPTGDAGKHAEAIRLLALIDSQRDVAPGVDCG